MTTRSQTIRLTSHQLRVIAVKIHRDPRSVAIAYAGKAKPIVHADVVEAARAEGFPLPPEPAQAG
jgi:hypothetical protein